MARELMNPRVSGYGDRLKFIIDRCEGKRVLDVGVLWNKYDAAGHRVGFAPSDLHLRLFDVADHLAGVDPSTDDMAGLQSEFPQLNLYTGDVEELDKALPVDERFDVVVMGDVIEHLSNPGRALDAIRPFLGETGKLLVTGPNGFGGPNLLRFLVGKFQESPVHVTAHTKYTMANLCARHGYEMVELWTAWDRPPSSTKQRLAYHVAIPLLRRFPDLGGTLVLIAQPTVGSRPAMIYHSGHV